MRTEPFIPLAIRFAPWADRRGRFHQLRAVVFALLLVPGAWLAGRWLTVGLGARPITSAIHSTGYAAVWLLLASLAISPAKALLGQPNLVVVRRMVGNAALVYAAAHLLLYCADDNWRPWMIVSEIAQRFYLTIGFIALLGLTVLGVTSTDGWIRSMGRNWKRLHRIVYALAALTLVHYMLQTKLDVSQAMLAVGVFAWFMLWRVLPAGQDRDWPVLLALSVAAAVVTLGAEYLWYRFGTRANVSRIIAGEFDITYGLHPAGQVLAAGLVATSVTELFRIGASPFGQRPAFTMGVYALGAFVGDILDIVLARPMSDATADMYPVLMSLAWAGLLAILGLARWAVQARWCRQLIDALWIACLLNQVLHLDAERTVATVLAMAILACIIALSARVWRVSRGAALMVVPLAVMLLLKVLLVV